LAGFWPSAKIQINRYRTEEGRRMGKANTKCVKGIDNVGNSVNEAFSWEEIAKYIPTHK